MIWLLDLIDDYRAAVKYYLLKHGYRLESLGTNDLPWSDAICILQEQNPRDSAVYRAKYPKDYDRDKLLTRVELLAVLLVRGQMMLGKQVEIADENLPTSYDEIFGEESTEQEEDSSLMSFDQIDDRMGWGRRSRQVPVELLTPEEIDQRMGW